MIYLKNKGGFEYFDHVQYQHANSKEEVCTVERLTDSRDKKINLNIKEETKKKKVSDAIKSTAVSKTH